MKPALLFLLCLSILTAGCENPEKRNQPPEPFAVTITKVASDNVRIEWEPASDPEGDPVSYTVTLNNQIEARNLVDIYEFEIGNLQPQTHYTGSVTATDDLQNARIIPFDFTTGINASPDPFKTEVTHVSFDRALIEWEKASDADNDPVYYSVFVNGQMIATDLSDSLSYQLTNLNPETHYEGFIRATDSKNNHRDIAFSFSTRKYFLMFSKLFKYVGDYYVTPYNIIATPDCGYIMACNGYIPDQNYMVAVKLDSEANIIWNTGIALDPGIGGGHMIKPSSDGGYLLLGEKQLVKLNNSGVIVWQYIPGAEFEHTRTFFHSFVQTDDNGYIIVGYYQPGITGIVTQGLVLKINENGELEWYKIAGTYYRTYYFDIEESGDGNCMIAGTTGGDYCHEVFVSKIDPDGNVLITQTYPNGDYNFVSQIKRTADDGFVIAGNRLGDSNLKDARILKITNDGILEWEKYFEWAYYLTYATSLTITSDNNIVFTGLAEVSRNGQQCFLSKLTAGGELQWKKFYPHTEVMGGCGTSGRYIDSTADGGFIVMGGKGCIWIDDAAESGLWIFKTDPEGNYEY